MNIKIFTPGKAAVAAGVAALLSFSIPQAVAGQHGNMHHGNQHRYPGWTYYPGIAGQDFAYGPECFDDGIRIICNPGYEYGRPPIRVYPYYPLLSCKTVRNQLKRIGYYAIVAQDCSGRKFVFKASQGKKRYVLSVDARTGRVLSRNRY